jgi:hypothetical protein
VSHTEEKIMKKSTRNGLVVGVVGAAALLGVMAMGSGGSSSSTEQDSSIGPRPQWIDQLFSQYREQLGQSGFVMVRETTESIQIRDAVGRYMVTVSMTGDTPRQMNGYIEVTDMPKDRVVKHVDFTPELFTDPTAIGRIINQVFTETYGRIERGRSGGTSRMSRGRGKS